MSYITLNSFIKFFLKSHKEVAFLMDIGNSFHALAPRKLKDRCPVARRYLIKSKSLRLVMVRLGICERFLNLCDRYLGAPSLRHLYIMTQSLNLSLWLMSSYPNDFRPYFYVSKLEFFFQVVKSLKLFHLVSLQSISVLVR